MSTSYEWWQNALVGAFGPVHDGAPQPGFYRKRTGKAAGYVPVAIWEQGGAMIATVDQKQADANEIWTYCCDKPITEAEYHKRVETGAWTDEDASVTASLAPPAVGHNAPTDEAEMLSDQINSALAGVDDYGQITDDETASRAQGLRSRLLELGGEAEKKHKTEKAPALEEGRRVDKRWFPLRDLAKTGADKIRAALGAHETRKDQARRAEEAARQKVAQDAERARLAAIEEGRPDPEPVPSPPPPPAPVPQTKIAGGYGRAASIKTVKVAKVIDQDAAYQGLKTHKELVDLIAALAQLAANAGHSIPGVEVTEEKRVV